MKSKIPPFIFFGAFLLLGVIIFKDYGVGWDELKNRQYGNITIDYVLGNDQDAGYYKDPEDFWNPKSGQFAKTHGPVFEVALVAAEKALHLDDQREKYLLRHIGTFLAFFLSVLFFYMLCRHIFSSMGTALLGSLFFALTPRIFAASFNDSMDIAFMMMFAASMYTMVRYLDEQNVSRAILHAAACAVMIDIRISGILIPVITILFVVFDTLVSKTSPKTFKKAVFSLLAYISLLCLLVVLLWPMLWENPLGQFISAFKTSARDPWTWWEIYLGKEVPGREVPWHFTPVWILITTPPLYTFLFIIGVLSLMKSFFHSPKTFYAKRKAYLLVFLCFLTPLVAVAVFNSTLFNGWRHLYFVYTGFLIISMAGFSSIAIFIRRKFKGPAHTLVSAAFSAIIIVSLSSTALFMIRSHPHQNIYFSCFAGGLKKAKQNFQIGYWGPEYKEGLEYILRNDSSKEIRIYLSEEPKTLRPVEFNANILKRTERLRLRFVKNAEKGDYFLTNYCSHIPKYEFQEIWSRTLDAVKILTVAKVK